MDARKGSKARGNKCLPGSKYGRTRTLTKKGCQNRFMWIPILITVEIRSYDSLSINKSKNAILAINRYIGSKNNSNELVTVPSNTQEKEFSFPTKRKMFTVLRSPHIDKKSREHFQWKQSKTTVFLEFKKPGEWDLFLFILENARLPGVQLLVGCQYSTFCAF